MTKSNSFRDNLENGFWLAVRVNVIPSKRTQFHFLSGGMIQKLIEIKTDKGAIISDLYISLILELEMGVSSAQQEACRGTKGPVQAALFSLSETQLE